MDTGLGQQDSRLDLCESGFYGMSGKVQSGEKIDTLKVIVWWRCPKGLECVIFYLTHSKYRVLSKKKLHVKSIERLLHICQWNCEKDLLWIHILTIY